MATSKRTRTSTSGPAPLEGNESWRSRGRVRRVGPATLDRSAWGRLPGWARHAICLGALALVAAAFYGPALGAGTLAGGDIVQWRAGAEAMFEVQEETGRLPLWNPGMFGGMPGYMVNYPDAALGVDSLLSWLRSLGLWPLAHAFAMLAGMYVLTWYLTRTELPGVMAAVGYGLTTYIPIILAAGHNTKFVALAYAPWLLLAFAFVLRTPPGSRWMHWVLRGCLFAIAAAVNLRAGHVQITYYVVVLAGLWWIAEGVAAVREGNGAAFAKATGTLALGSALALTMVAQPYLPQWEYKAFTTRGAGAGGGLDWDYAMSWSQGWGEMLTLLIPDAYGGGSPTYWGEKPFTAGPHYVGPVVIALAVLGVLGVRRRSVAALGAGVVLMAGFALGANFELLNRPAYRALPLFNAFRVPETWLSIVALALALLAAWGSVYLVRREVSDEAGQAKHRRALITFAVMAVGLAVLWIAGGSVFSFERPGEREQVRQTVQQIYAQADRMNVDRNDPRVQQAVRGVQGRVEALPAQRADLFRSDTGRALLLLVLAGGIVGLLLRERVPAWAALAGLVLLVIIDLWGVGRRYFNEDIEALRPRSEVASTIPRTQALQFLAEREREAGGKGYFRVLPSNPTQNAIPSFVAESAGGYHGAKLALIQDYFDEILPDGRGGYNANALDLLSIRYVMARGAVPGLTPVMQDQQSGEVVLENADALPRAFLVDSVQVLPNEAALINRLRSASFTPRTTALLLEQPDQEGGLNGSPTPDSILALGISQALPGGSDQAPSPALPDSMMTPRVRLVRFSADEIVWRVRTDRPRLLVASEIFYPAGWKATVGDRPTPIIRTNYLLRGVAVPSGEHLVRMTFEPGSHRWGVLISWVATLLAYFGAIGLGGLLWYPRGDDEP